MVISDSNSSQVRKIDVQTNIMKNIVTNLSGRNFHKHEFKVFKLRQKRGFFQILAIILLNALLFSHSSFVSLPVRRIVDVDLRFLTTIQIFSYLRETF